MDGETMKDLLGFITTPFKYNYIEILTWEHGDRVPRD